MRRRPGVYGFSRAVLFSSLLLFAGCTSASPRSTLSKVDQALYDQEVIETPGGILGTNTVFKTNVVVVDIGSTNPVTGEVHAPKFAQVILPEIVYAYAQPTYTTNLIPRTTIDGGLRVMGALPFPYAGTAAILLGWLYHIYAAARNKKLNVALVKSVEKGREFLDTTPEGQKVKAQFTEIMANTQRRAGVQSQVDKILDEHVH